MKSGIQSLEVCMKVLYLKVNVSILKSKSISIYTFRVDISLLNVISVLKHQANSGIQSLDVCIILYTFCCMSFPVLKSILLNVSIIIQPSFFRVDISAQKCGTFSRSHIHFKSLYF